MKTIQKKLGAIWGTRWWWGSLRVMVFLGTVNLCLMGLRLPAARAAAEGAARRAGVSLMRELGPSVVGPTQGVLINGQRLFVASRTTELTPGQVLGIFERHCRDGAREWKDELANLSTPADARPLFADASRLTTFRIDPDGDSPGQVACLVPNGSMGGVKGLLGRMSLFVRTGDLSALGDARLAVVQGNARTGVTHVLAVWSEGPFSLLKIFPAHGDAPGQDSPYAPRPADSVRVLSAEMEGRPYAMRLYDTTRPRADVLDEYSKSMSARGWTTLPIAPTPEIDMNDRARVFGKDSTAVLVVLNETPLGKTGVTLLEMGAAGFARTTEGAP